MPSSLLKRVRQKYSQDELAEKLDVSAKTISRWETLNSPSRVQEMALSYVLAEEKGAYQDQRTAFRFIDLFAGIGGTRLGMESIGGRCVWTSEWDKFSQKTYATNFPDEHSVHGDIREAREEEIPKFDLLVGGFPCQPFSIAGVSKKNSLGTPHGFECKTQGTLFFDVARINCSPSARCFCA